VAIPVLIGPWLLVRAARGQRVFPPRKVIGILLLGALATQVLGNPIFQWSLGVVGISLAVPILLGTIIVGSAVLSRVFLGEMMSRSLAMSVAVLLAAIGLLALAANQSAPVSAISDAAVSQAGGRAWIMMAGVAGVLVAGLAFSTLGVVIRYGVRGVSPPSTTTVIVGVTGVLVLGGMSLGSLGWQGMLATPPSALGVMIAAGVCNATAFICLTMALQLISVVRVNAIGSSQCALAALAGVLLFNEPLSLALIGGLVLTVGGLSLMGGRDDGGRTPPEESRSDPDEAAIDLRPR
jgi:drug/metabolite transporter (DMT)-like permease